MKHLYFIFIITIFIQTLQGQLLVDSLKIVDYHVHIFSENLLSNLEKQGYNMAKSGFQILETDKSAYKDIDRIMQQNSNAKMLLITGGYAYDDLDQYHNALTEKMVKEENDLLKALVNRYPDRLIGFYGVHPLRSFSIREIKRCDEDLELHGIKLHLQGNRINLDDVAHVKKLQAIFELAAERDIPLLIHNNAWELNAGAAYARKFIDTFLQSEDPLTIIFAHTGGGGAYFNFTHDLLSVFRSYFKNDKRSKKHHIYFELSGTVSGNGFPGEHPMSDLADMIMAIGEEKFLFGSDYPFRSSKAYIEEISRELELQEVILKRIIERDIFERLKR